jgi:DNA-binding CsgD family transcriptional regulator
MASHALGTSKKVTSIGGGQAPAVELLISKLIDCAGDGNDSDTTYKINGSSQQIILDAEVNGIRCLLVRLHPDIVHGHVWLSPREREIARMVAKGYPNKTIAAVLEISSWTVCTHLRRIFTKLGVGSRAAMVARLLEDDLMGDQHSKSSDRHARYE